MGKYMKKGKITGGEVSVMEIPLGVRTRARTLALQPNPELSYLQLRSRRLEKPQFQPKLDDGVGNSRVRVKSESTRADEGRVGGIEQFCDLGNEGSRGDNSFDFGERERSTRESTPCSLIRDTEVIGTPRSTMRPISASRRARNAEMAIPTTLEMEEFFVGFELLQQKQFIDKYNYDIMKDLPIPGRYEWVRVDN